MQFLAEKAAKNNEKESTTASRHEMASMMHICSGWVGPQSGNAEKVLVFKAFLKGPRKPRVPQGKCATERAGPKKLDF